MLPAATVAVVGIVDGKLLFGVGAGIPSCFSLVPHRTVVVAGHHDGVLAILGIGVIVVHRNLHKHRVVAHSIEDVGTLSGSTGVDTHVVRTVGQVGDELGGDEANQSAAVVGVDVASGRTVIPLSAVGVVVAITLVEVPASLGLQLRVLDVGGVVGGVHVVVEVLLLYHHHQRSQLGHQLIDGVQVAHLGREHSLLLLHEVVECSLARCGSRSGHAGSLVVDGSIGVHIVLQQIDRGVELGVSGGVADNPVLHIVVGERHDVLGSAIALAAILLQRSPYGGNGLAVDGAVAGDVFLVLGLTLLSLVHGLLQSGHCLDIVGAVAVLGNGIVQGLLVNSEVHGGGQRLRVGNLLVESSLDSLGGSLAQIVETEVGGAEPSGSTRAIARSFGTDGQLTVDHQHLLLGSHRERLPLVVVPAFSREGVGNLLAGDGLCIDVLVGQTRGLCHQVGAHGVVTVGQTLDVLCDGQCRVEVVVPCVPAAALALPVQALVATVGTGPVPSLAGQVGAGGAALHIEVGSFLVVALGEHPLAIGERRLGAGLDEPGMADEDGEVGRILLASLLRHDVSADGSLALGHGSQYLGNHVDAFFHIILLVTQYLVVGFHQGVPAGIFRVAQIVLHLGQDGIHILQLGNGFAVFHHLLGSLAHGYCQFFGRATQVVFQRHHIVRQLRRQSNIAIGDGLVVQFGTLGNHVQNVRLIQLGRVGLANLVELDTVETDDGVIARTGVSRLEAKLHRELCGGSELKLMLHPLMRAQASAGFVPEHFLATGNFGQVFGSSVRVGVDVDSPVFQTIDGTVEIHHLAIAAATAPTGAQVEHTLVVVGVEVSGLGGNREIGGAIVSHGNGSLAQVVGHSTKVHPFTFLVGRHVGHPAADGTNETVGGL